MADSSSEVSNKALETKVADEAVRFFYSNLIGISIIQFTYPVIVLWAFYGKVDDWLLIIWFVASMLLYLARILIARAYIKKKPPPEEAPTWGGIFHYHRIDIRCFMGGFWLSS